jgi:UDP-hydrolysing UDP-N-acetyl-D-glucosamine 2-epimerase
VSERTIAVLTSGRQDWGILRPCCEAIRATEGLRLRLLVGGMHLSARHGTTADRIVEDGFEPDLRLDWMGDEGDAAADAGRALQGVARALRGGADALLLAGDRFETAAAAVAATIERVPIAHLHGGEVTEGAFDDAFRNAITKLAHLHLVSNEEHARRVIAMGEDEGSVHVVGAPGLDGATRPDLASRDELEEALHTDLAAPVVIVTVQPTTLDADPAAIVHPILAAMDRVEATYVVTLPNADPGADAVRAALASVAGPRRAVTEALGERRYWGLMRIADAMLGNSSSGIVEAPVVDLPVVNVGDRQRGRHRLANVIDVPAVAGEVETALRRTLDPATRDRIRGHRPPLADGLAGRRVADIIAGWRPAIPPRKRSIPIPWPTPSS